MIRANFDNVRFQQSEQVTASYFYPHRPPMASFYQRGQYLQYFIFCDGRQNAVGND
jgi:hypothetical protein